MLNEQIKNAILKLQEKYPNKRSALIPALHLAQSQLGFLPREIQTEVAALFQLDANEVNSIVSFYDMFFEEPVGKHVLHVCKNVSCMLRGADEVLQALCNKLNVEPHQTTADKEFTVIPCECLGACDKAPMMIVDDEVVGPIKLTDIDNILKQAKESKGHPSPVSLEEEAFHA